MGVTNSSSLTSVTSSLNPPIFNMVVLLSNLLFFFADPPSTATPPGVLLPPDPSTNTGRFSLGLNTPNVTSSFFICSISSTIHFIDFFNSMIRVCIPNISFIFLVCSAISFLDFITLNIFLCSGNCLFNISSCFDSKSRFCSNVDKCLVRFVLADMNVSYSV